jgi:hypothetical protein
MATTIINPPANSKSSETNGMGFLLGIIVLIIFLALFFVYALPYLRGLGGFGSGGVQVNIPKNVNVKVQQTK